MSRPIIVPLDGSPLAENALVPAVSLARALRAPVHLIRVTDAEPSPISYTFLSAVTDATAHEIVTAGEAYLHAIAMRVEGEIDGAEVTAREIAGAPSKSIIEYARRAGASTIVMATRRHDGSNRVVLSSVADAVARRAGIPVLLTGPETTPTRRLNDWECKRILIPVDESRLARRIILPALQIARGFSARITLLHVLPASNGSAGYSATPFGVGLEPIGGQRSALHRLEEIAQVLRSSGISVDTRVVQTALPTADAVLNEAVDTHAELIALATRGHGVAKRFAFGSIAHELVKRAQLPMLVLAPLDKSEHEGDVISDGVPSTIEVGHA